MAVTLSNPGLMGLGEDGTDSFIHSALIEHLLCAPHGTRRPAEREAHLVPPERGQLALCRGNRKQITHISPIMVKPMANASSRPRLTGGSVRRDPA